jgi:hypothetical protein
VVDPRSVLTMEIRTLTTAGTASMMSSIAGPRRRRALSKLVTWEDTSVVAVLMMLEMTLVGTMLGSAGMERETEVEVLVGVTEVLVEDEVGVAVGHW